MTTLLAQRAESVDRIEPTDEALLQLLGQLKRRGYDFITPTPATHARVNSRHGRSAARDLRDVLGWSLPFDEQLLDSEVLEALVAAKALMELPDGRLRSRYRVSSLDDVLLLHSSYPTDAADAVFFGPDSYRFASLDRSELTRCPQPAGSQLVDIGTGAGVGAIIAGKLCPELRLTMTDINPEALRLARINARAAGLDAGFRLGDKLDPVSGQFDVVLANPPFIIDPAGRDYRDGGGMHGAQVAYEMAVATMERLAPHGRLILYTGSAIIHGDDPLRTALRDAAAEHGCTLEYWEIDPDVFGEELDKSAYSAVERIAIVAAVITRAW
jgi:methylase of polypeptide subunit release factors